MEGGNATTEDGLSKAIGERFLLEYFKFASENTANLHKFYRKNAVCCFDDGTPVVGPAKIGEKLAVLQGAVFDLIKDGPTCAFQSTADGGILIMVVGYVSLRNSSGGVDAPRRFVQTFHLLPKDQNTFSIANDMHRFISSETESKPVPAATAPLAPATVVPAPVAAPTNGQVTEPKKEEPKPIQQNAVAEHKPSASPASPQPAAAKGERAPRAQKPAIEKTQQPAQPPPAEKKEAPAKPSGPPSYAQAARSSPQASSSNGVSKPAAAPKTEKPKEVGESPAARPASPPTGSSVFVKNGQTVAQQALTDALSAFFGPVVSITMKGSGAVVTLSSVKEVETALASKEIVVEGATLTFEVYRGSSGRGGQRRGGGGSTPSGAQSDGAKRSGGAGSQRPRTEGKPAGGSSGDKGSNGRPSQPRQSSTNSGSKPRSSGSSGAAAKPASAAQ